MRVRTTIIGLLVGTLLMCGGCENLGRPKTEARPEPDEGPSAVSPGGCENLCARQATCLKRFRELGAEPLFVASPETPCDKACDTTARDRLVGKLLNRIIGACTGRKDCDAFYGCALRMWLTHLRTHPYKRVVLRARRHRRAVADAVRRSQPKRAMQLCDDAKLFRDLARQKKPAATRASKALANVCAGAVKLRLESVVRALEVLVSKLEPDAHVDDCREVRAWKPPQWLPVKHPARQRISRARALCDTLDEQRKLAFAIQYAERDAAVVLKALKSGKSGDATYYKCVHKAKTLATLEGARQIRAQAAAKTLREVCFEQFPTAFLTRHRKAGAAFQQRHCYKVKLVAGLLSKHASRAVVSSRSPLIRWARTHCPDP